MAEKFNLEASVGYVLGIASIVFAFVSPIAGLVMGILGITTTKNQKTELSKKTKKICKIGIIISIVVLLLVIGLAAYTGVSTLQDAFPIA